MPITDTDRLSTPADMVDLLKRLAKIMRDVETLPDNAQQRFWEDAGHHLNAVPNEEINGSAVSTRSVTVLRNILLSMFGQQLAEAMREDAHEYYDKMMVQLKEASARPPSDWDNFLDERFEATKSTDHEGSITASVYLATINRIGCGTLKRVDGSLLKLTSAEGQGSGAAGTERYFSSKDIIMMEFVPG